MALPSTKATRQKWNVPVSVLLAQSALESGWGRHVVGNAYFGIKGKAPDGASSNFGATEVVNGKVIHIKDNFRAYTSYADAADDYGRFLSQNPRYKTAFRHATDPVQFVNEIAKAGHVTDPNYAKSLTGIIHAHNLVQYDK